MKELKNLKERCHAAVPLQQDSFCAEGVQFTDVFSVAWAAQNCVLINHRCLEIFLWAVSSGGEKGNILGETHTFLLSS
jgi:hypothetical protein